MNHALLLWSQVDPLSFGRNFRAASENFPWTGAIITSLVLLTLATLLIIAARRAALRESRGYRHPRRLFAELCRAHQLDPARRKLLERLAAEQKLSQPSLLFLDPDRFQADRLGPSLAAEREEIERLREQLFS
jgi:hypothetical protein